MFLLILVQDADGDMPQSLLQKAVCSVHGVCAATKQMLDLS